MVLTFDKIKEILDAADIHYKERDPYTLDVVLCLEFNEKGRLVTVGTYERAEANLHEHEKPDA
jgi:hypothetical protein